MSEKPAATEYARHRRELPGSARAKLREAMEAPPEVGAGRAVAACAGWAGAPRRVVDAWAAVDELGGNPEVPWAMAADETRRWLRPPESDAEPADVELRLTRAVEAAERCGRCGRWWGVEVGEGSTLERRLLAERCNTRACLSCTRARLGKVVDRWAPLYAAPVRPGYRLSFVTIGSVGRITTKADVMGYLRRIGRVCRVMREGSPKYGIPARSWVGGLRALEVMPRPDGGWSHVHLAVVRADFYPYGLHAGKLPAAPTPEQLGFRGMLRDVGCGEVFRDDRVTTATDPNDPVGPLGKYMKKLERYMKKVCPEGEGDGPESAASVAGALTWQGRRDVLAAVRGVRLLQPFGDCLGLLGGPDRVRLFEEGKRVKLAVREAELYDPTDRETFPVLGEWEGYGGTVVEDMPPAARPDGRRVERSTYYRGDVLESWRPWCDVDRLRAGMLTPVRLGE